MHDAMLSARFPSGQRRVEMPLPRGVVYRPVIAKSPAHFDAAASRAELFLAILCTSMLPHFSFGVDGQAVATF